MQYPIFIQTSDNIQFLQFGVWSPPLILVGCRRVCLLVCQCAMSHMACSISMVTCKNIQFLHLGVWPTSHLGGELAQFGLPLCNQINVFVFVFVFVFVCVFEYLSYIQSGVWPTSHLGDGELAQFGFQPPSNQINCQLVTLTPPAAPPYFNIP